ncbi:MAG: phosphate ABC transporter substrate-binding protein, PhoT family [Terrimonas sp.]|nr:phosphate ABC transporter substrate-binding protein, PhoT family [Terrimonas sp.]
MRRFARNIFYGLPLLVCILLLWGNTACNSRNSRKNEPTDTRKTGSIYISADESFKPVIDSHIAVFETDISARIHVQYKPEAACLEDLLVDSIRMVIIARTISPEEKNLILDSLHVATSQMIMAYDAVAVIVNPASTYTRFTMDDLKLVLTGKFKENLIPVFDGLRATSTISFIIDSVLRGDSLTDKAVAAHTSEEVIDYVSKTPNAIGFIGVSWIGNPEDPKQESFLTKVKLAMLQSKDDKNDFIKPWQANIYAGRYPMIRKLVYILKETHNGLGHGFADFLLGERGQLIFKRAYLLPAKMQFNIRRAAVREE